MTDKEFKMALIEKLDDIKDSIFYAMSEMADDMAAISYDHEDSGITFSYTDRLFMKEKLIKDLIKLF